MPTKEQLEKMLSKERHEINKLQFKHWATHKCRKRKCHMTAFNMGMYAMTIFIQGKVRRMKE